MNHLEPSNLLDNAQHKRFCQLIRLWICWVVLPLVVIASVVLVQGQEEVPAETQAALLQDGLQVYTQYYCGICHRLDAAGTKGAFGPSHNAMHVIAGARIQDPNYRGTATTAEEYLRESILEPEAYLVPGYVATPHRMPAYTHLSDPELDALVFLLMQQ